METAIKESRRRAGWTCALAGIGFLLVILNWRLPIAIRASSDEVNSLLFSVAIVVLPLVVVFSALKLSDFPGAILAGVAVCLLSLAAMVWSSFTLDRIGYLMRGQESTPLITSVRFGFGRVAAYRVWEGPYVELRIQYPLMPGLYMSRVFATIDSQSVNGLFVLPSGELCVTFPSEPSLGPGVNQFRAVLPVYPLFDRSFKRIEGDPLFDPAVKRGVGCAAT
jgi:hypothetical protein